MLSVDQHKGSACDKATPNVLPCRIQHDGPISEADSYWRPSQEPGISTPTMEIDSVANSLPRWQAGGLLQRPKAAR